METDAATPPAVERSRVIGRWIGWAGLALWLLALAAVVVLAPDGLRESADPGTEPTPLWRILVAPLAAIALIRLLPPRTPDLTPEVRDLGRLRTALVGLLACAVAFPLVVGIAGLDDSGWYLVVKVALLIAVPVLILRRTRGSIADEPPRVAWRWWAPAVVVAVWIALEFLAPWVEGPDLSHVPVLDLVVVGLLTALTAGLGEELFYRHFLQTRLEALLGRWGGIVVASLVFALMHVSDRQGGGLLEVAGAIVAQGTFGVLVGYAWSKYRNLWLIVAAHVTLNGWFVVASLIR